MRKNITEITLINDNADELKIRIDHQDDDIAELYIDGRTFWFGRNEWNCIAEALQEVCK